MTPVDTAKRPSLAAVIAGFAAVYIVWGSTYLAIKYAIETLPLFTMAGTRFFFAGAGLYAYARWCGAARPTARQWRDAAIVGGLLLYVSNGGVVWSQKRVASGVAALLIATVPMWMVLLDWLRPGGVRPRTAVFAGLFLGLVGITMLKVPRGDGGAGFHVDSLGAAVLILVSLTWSFGSLYSRSAARPDSALLGAGMQMLAGGGLHLLTGVILGEWASIEPAGVSLRSLLAVAYLLVFGSIVGFTTYMWLLRVSTPAKVATYAYVNPLVALFLGWLLAGERLDGQALAAAGVIVAGVVVITRAKTAPAVSPAPRTEMIASTEYEVSAGSSERLDKPAAAPAP